MRIGTVDVCKAVFALLICLYHFFNVVSPNPYLPLGDVMVELYVLIAGVFFFMSWEKKKAAGSGYTDSPYPYLKHRFGRFLPYSAVGFALAAAVDGLVSGQHACAERDAGVDSRRSDGNIHGDHERPE